MSNTTTATIIPIGNYDWYVLRVVGNKYFVLAESPLFRGYYAIESCAYAESRLASFLTNKFIAQLKHSGVDTSKVTNVSILTAGQYSMYVKDKLPTSATPYMLQTAHPEMEDCILAVNSDGELYPSKITESCGIRPCMFIDKEYADGISGIDPSLIVGVSVANKAKEAGEPVVPASGTKPEQSYEEVKTEPEKKPDTVVETVEPVSVTPSETVEPGPSVETQKIEQEQTDSTEQVEVRTPGPESPESSQTETVEVEVVPEEKQEEIESVDTETILNMITGKTDEVPNETELGSVETETRPVQITEVGTKHAAYVFDEDEYKNFAVLYAGGEQELKGILSEYGLTVTAFLRSSVIADRRPPKAEEIQAFMEQQKQRFRWRKN